MLDTLSVSHFRAFESFRLDSLTRVNLLVGKNNSGKTSVLEAAELLGAGGDPSVIRTASQRRGETRAVGPASRFRRSPALAHLFHGHGCEPGASFSLECGSHSVHAELCTFDQLDDDFVDAVLEDDRFTPEADPVMGLTITLGAPTRTPEFVLPVTEDGFLLDDGRRPLRRRETGVRFLSLRSVNPPHLAENWNGLVSAGRESEVVDDMRLLMPEIDTIHFLSGSTPALGGIVVGMRGRGPRVPLGSFGDGMRRLLLLRLSLASNGTQCVLIDEVDTGLHWTVMSGMWHLVVEAAIRSDLQVFATTHSLDCTRGLASMVKANPHLADYVSVHKIDPRLGRAITAQGSEIHRAVEGGIDFR